MKANRVIVGAFLAGALTSYISSVDPLSTENELFFKIHRFLQMRMAITGPISSLSGLDDIYLYPGTHSPVHVIFRIENERIKLYLRS